MNISFDFDASSEEEAIALTREAHAFMHGYVARAATTGEMNQVDALTAMHEGIASLERWFARKGVKITVVRQ